MAFSRRAISFWMTRFRQQGASLGFCQFAKSVLRHPDLVIFKHFGTAGLLLDFMCLRGLGNFGKLSPIRKIVFEHDKHEKWLPKSDCPSPCSLM